MPSVGMEPSNNLIAEEGTPIAGSGGVNQEGSRRGTVIKEKHRHGMMGTGHYMK
jgi:hypothetical protein